MQWTQQELMILEVGKWLQTVLSSEHTGLHLLPLNQGGEDGSL